MLAQKKPTEPRTRWLLLVLLWLAPGVLQLIQEASYSRAYGATDFQLLRELPTFAPTWLPWRI